MAYVPINWQARTGSGLNRFLDQNGNLLILTASPAEVINEGTPFTADNMNHIDQGIKAAHDAIDAKANPGLLVSNLSLPTSGYSGSGPYTKTFTVTGATTDAGKRYDLMPDYSATKATRDLQKVAWGLIDDARITTTNTLTVTVTAVPVTAVPFSLVEKVVKAVS